MKPTPAPEWAIATAVAAIEMQSAELAKLKTQRQAMVKLRAAQESHIRERPEWLQRHAVTLRTCNITPPGGEGATEFQLDGPAIIPNSGFTLVGKAASGKCIDGARFESARLHFAAEPLRNLCDELDLSVLVTWSGKRGDGRRGRPRNASCTFSVNSYSVSGMVDRVADTGNDDSRW